MVSTHPTAYNRRGTSLQHSFCVALPQFRGFSFFRLKSETEGDWHCAVWDKASLRSYLQHVSLRCANLETADFEDSHKDARASAPSRQGKRWRSSANTGHRLCRRRKRSSTKMFTACLSTAQTPHAISMAWGSISGSSGISQPEPRDSLFSQYRSSTVVQVRRQ